MQGKPHADGVRPAAAVKLASGRDPAGHRSPRLRRAGRGMFRRAV